MFHFARPVWVWTGLGLVLLGLWAFRRADRRRRADLAKLAHPRFHGKLVAGWSPGLRRARRGLWLAAVLALTLAAAGPRYGYEWREVKRRGIDILFAVDTSQSMLAEDLSPNRLERARLGIIDFLERLEGDRVGLVPFAGSAFALCPLTLDYDAFREALNALNTGLIPQQGTDLASAIEEAGRLFDEEGNNHRFLVLITDGEDLEGEALKAAEKAAEEGTTIYTVGVGGAEGQLIPVRDDYGRQGHLRDAAGELVRTKLEPETLEKIAAATGGLYVPLGRGAEGLESIYEQRLALVPKSELAQQLERVPLERFQWPLGAGLLMLALQAVMGERRREKKVKWLASVARRVRPVAVGLVVCGISPGDLRADGVSDYNEGTEAYEKGEFEDAAGRLKDALATADLELQAKTYYNLGNSLYRVGQGLVEEDPKKTIASWEQSVKAFEDALELDAADEDARFNRDFVKRKLEELKQEQQPEDQEKDEQEDSEDQKKQDSGEEEKQNPQESENQDGGEQKEENQEQGAQEGDKQDGEKEGSEGEPKDEAGEDGSAGEAEGEEAEPKGQEELPPEEDAAETGEEHGDGEPGEEKEGEAAKEAGEAGDSGGEGGVAEQREVGEMSREEAIRLLESLGDDERVVVPAPLSERSRERARGGARRKNW